MVHQQTLQAKLIKLNINKYKNLKLNKKLKLKLKLKFFI